MLRNAGVTTYEMVTRDLPMPKLAIKYTLLLLDGHPWAKISIYSFSVTTVTQGQIRQILLLHVKKARIVWSSTPLYLEKYETYTVFHKLILCLT